jgi:hypothetical protein
VLFSPRTRDDLGQVYEACCSWFRVHSGWTALVAISLEGDFPLVLLRERPHLVRTFTYEFRQPYHTAGKKTATEASGFIARARAEARRLSYRVITQLRRILMSKVMSSSAAAFFLLPEGRFRVCRRFWHHMR